MQDTKPKILLVEDDPNLGNVLREFLEMKNYEVDLQEDGNKGLTAILKNNYDLCILDVMMPGKDGFTLAKDIRTNGKDVPIIFVTAKADIADKIEGFEAGADDYLAKPFSMEELIMRINAVLRRSGEEAGDADKEEYTIGNLKLNSRLRTLEDGGETRKLSSKEADLLLLLCRSENKLLTREAALKTIWGDDSYYNARSMDVYITRLRKYLKSDDRLQIMNIHGTGYKLITP